MTNRWGPSVWKFFHSLVHSVKEDSFPIIGRQLLNFIVQISSMLPCSDCSAHAKEFFSKINLNHFNTKDRAIDLMYIFHNVVNKNTKKEIFPRHLLFIYDHINVFSSYNSFVIAYKSNIPSKLTTETFSRQSLLKRLHEWLVSSRFHFTIPQNPHPPVNTP
jgi:hypothetical protein